MCIYYFVYMYATMYMYVRRILMLCDVVSMTVYTCTCRTSRGTASPATAARWREGGVSGRRRCGRDWLRQLGRSAPTVSCKSWWKVKNGGSCLETRFTQLSSRVLTVSSSSPSRNDLWSDLYSSEGSKVNCSTTVTHSHTYAYTHTHSDTHTHTHTHTLTHRR